MPHIENCWGQEREGAGRECAKSECRRRVGSTRRLVVATPWGGPLRHRSGHKGRWLQQLRDSAQTLGCGQSLDSEFAAGTRPEWRPFDPLTGSGPALAQDRGTLNLYGQTKLWGDHTGGGAEPSGGILLSSPGFSISSEARSGPCGSPGSPSRWYAPWIPLLTSASGCAILGASLRV